MDSSQQKFFVQKDLTYLAFKITSLKFLKCSFFYVGVYYTLYKGFHIFARVVQLVLQNQCQMQIAQDKCLSISKIHCQGRLMNQFCNKICPMDILSDPEPVYLETSGGVNS